MSDTVISVENVGKRYALSHNRNGERYTTLRDVIARQAAAPFKAIGKKIRGRSASNGSQPHNSSSPHSKNSVENFWALKNVSFEIKQGEVVGIIGRNGAGKSTLLKILSRITEPTEGRIRIKGRVASLLEVGTGFHPELTGRENIYLNGSILGMSRAEIKAKFDEIVAFSEVEKFLDTPVKRYSSGMYVRLAFAVAAHLEPEILIVDEVLAVGDAEFQKKCLGKMEDASKGGRTVLFVSHNMPSILRLCQRVVLLQGGTLAGDGLAEEIAHQYLSSGANRAAERVWSTPEQAPGDEVAKLHAVRVRSSRGKITETIDVSEPFEIEVEYWNLQDRIKPTVSIHFTNEDGVLLFVSNDFSNHDWWSSTRQPGRVRARCRVPAHLLAEGRFLILAALCTYNPNNLHALERDVVSFQVVDQYDLEKIREKYTRPWPGALRPKLEWRVEEMKA
jgi:lipopolysaccharide transport system ATP-binding protein